MSSTSSQASDQSEQEQSTAWQPVSDALTSDSPPGLVREFPAPAAAASLLAGLAHPEIAATDDQAEMGRKLQRELSGLLSQLDTFGQLSRCPVLAITGFLNAGKSSLLATYLSPKNRQRVLRGLGNQAGTHRFVLWLPQVWWDDPELFNTLLAFLTDLFGHAPEHLSDDPHVAALQYNGQIVPAAVLQSDTAKQDAAAGTQTPTVDQAASEVASVDPMHVPLIAYDQRLNALQIGLVDCPDIQTGFVNRNQSAARGEALALARQAQLKQIGRLCSAFVVVARMNSLHDEGLVDIFSALRDAMPGVPRLLAVNRVKARYAPSVVYDQARGVADRFGIRSVYVAYDFRSALADTRVPSPPPDSNIDGRRLPIFFEADSTGGEGTDRVASERESTVESHGLRFLYDLGARLDAGTLSRESGRSLRLQLKAKANEGLQWLERNQQMLHTHAADAWEALAAACYEFMAERDSTGRSVGLRLQASPAIVAQMADSLFNTAPLWMKASLSIDRTARQLQAAVANSAARFKILQTASDSVTQFAKRFRRGEGAQVVTKERFAKTVRRSDTHQALSRLNDEQLEQRCEHAMSRFASEDKTQLDQAQLDRWSREIWKNMSFKDKLWKGTQPLAVLMAPLLAVVLVPFDGGGSAVLVFASVKELLAAAGLAAVMGPLATGSETLQIVHRETPWRQLSDLFAILCDCIGLQRPPPVDLPATMCDRTPRQLLSSNTKVKTAKGTAAVFVWKLNPPAVQQLQRDLQRLS